MKTPIKFFLLYILVIVLGFSCKNGGSNNGYKDVDTAQPVNER